MTTPTEKDCDRLQQAGMLESFKATPSLSEMVTVYLSDRSDSHDYGIYCALVPSGMVKDSLADAGWDVMHGFGMPEIYASKRGSSVQVEYLRHGTDSGIEPLVIDRDFHEMRPAYKEICEEFRLFHRLHYDQKSATFTKFADDGAETLVATVQPDRIRIRLLEIRQFLAIKEMNLAILFDCREHSPLSLADLGLKEASAERRADPMRWAMTFGDFGGLAAARSFSRLVGKRFILPLAKKPTTITGCPEGEERKYESFIIGIDGNGKDITNTSNPDRLANYFGANPGAPHYLTPVQFRKEVLDKYYQNAAKYSIGDSILRCGALWSMYMDNHHADKVYAWLGDLGRDLPSTEQLHWRSHNVPPSGEMSTTFLRRQKDGLFADSDSPEHVFRLRYHALATAGEEVLGWMVLLALAPDDQHYLTSIRLPASDEQKEFDDLVLALAKVLVDSINERALNELLESEVRGTIKGSIARLESVLSRQGVVGYEEHCVFLRRLQGLRSAGSAHRKGTNYEQSSRDVGLADASRRQVFAAFMKSAINYLQFMERTVREGKLARRDSR